MINNNQENHTLRNLAIGALVGGTACGSLVCITGLALTQRDAIAKGLGYQPLTRSVGPTSEIPTGSGNFPELGKSTPAAILSETKIDFTCAEVGTEKLGNGRKLVHFSGFPDDVGGDNLFTVDNVNNKFSPNPLYKNNDVFGQTAIAEPGSLMVSNFNVTEAPFTFDAKKGGFIGVALQEGIIEMPDGRQVLLREMQDAMHWVVITEPNEDSDSHLRVKLRCIVPNHVQVQQFADGAFVSKGQADQIIAATNSGEDLAGLPTTNCGSELNGDGCRRTTVTIINSNTNTFESWTRSEQGAKWELVDANFGK